MRLLIVSLLPADPEIGPGGNLRWLAREMEKRGHPVDLIGREDLPLTRRFPSLRQIFCPFEIFCAVFSRCLKQGHYDAVEISGDHSLLAFWLLRCLWPATLRLLRTETPLSIRVRQSFSSQPHHFWRWLFNPASWPQLWLRLTFSLVHGAVLWSPHEVAWLAEEKWVKIPLTYLPPEVRDDLLAPALPAKNPREFLWLGPWEEGRGSLLAAQIFQQLHRLDPACRLTVAGTGPAEVFASFPPALHPNLTVKPLPAAPDWAALCADRSFLLAPGQGSGAGSFILEAMAQAVIPLLAGDQPLAPYLKESGAALLLAEPNSAAAAVAVAAAWDDPPRLTALGTAAWETARRLGCGAAAESRLAFYRRCLPLPTIHGQGPKRCAN